MRRTYLLAFTIYFVAIVVRLLPLTYSSLPYNIDGFSLVNIAERTQSSGHLIPALNDPNLGNYKVPSFATLLVILSDAFGVPPLLLIQLTIPIITATSILAAFALVRQLTKNDTASSFAALFLALEGTYVFFTATSIKASIAFALMPIILFLYWKREDNRRRALAAFLLVSLPLVHHLSSLVMFSMISLLLFVDIVQWWRQGTLTLRRLAVEVGLGPALLIPGLVYYQLVSLMYLKQVEDPRQVVLFLSVLLVAALVQLSLSMPAKLGPWLIAKRKRRRWGRIFDEKVLYPVAVFALLVVNQYSNVFAGTIQTKPVFFLALAPYLVLVVVCIIGFNLIRHTENKFRPLAMALILAPFSIMIFAFLRGLDPFSFALMYRTYDYMDLGIAICAGVGMAFLLRLAKRTSIKAVLAVGFSILLVLTLPLGYRSADLYDVENATAQYEFQAMTHLNQIGAAYVGSDQRLFDTMAWYFLQNGDMGLPYKIIHGTGLGTYDFALVEAAWTTTGAQEHPLPNVVVDSTKLANFMEENNVVYSITSPLGEASIIQLRHT